MRARVGAILLVCTALAVSACGDDDYDGGSVGGGRSNAGFVEQASAICQKVNEVSSGVGQPTSQKEAVAAAEKIVAAAETGVNDLKGLDPPAGVKADFDRLVAAYEKQTRLTRRLAKAGKANDQKRGADLGAQLAANQREYSLVALKVGLAECAK